MTPAIHPIDVRARTRGIPALARFTGGIRPTCGQPAGASVKNCLYFPDIVSNGPAIAHEDWVGVA